MEERGRKPQLHPLIFQANQAAVQATFAWSSWWKLNKVERELTWCWRPDRWTLWPPGRSTASSWSTGWAWGCSRCAHGWRGSEPSPWLSAWEQNRTNESARNEFRPRKQLLDDAVLTGSGWGRGRPAAPERLPAWTRSRFRSGRCSRGAGRSRWRAAPGTRRIRERFRQENQTPRTWRSNPSTRPRYLEALQLVVSVHDQLRLVAVHSDEDHVVGAVVHIATNQLVGGPIGEGLEERDRKLAFPLWRTFPETFPPPTCYISWKLEPTSSFYLQDNTVSAKGAPTSVFIPVVGTLVLVVTNIFSFVCINRSPVNQN